MQYWREVRVADQVLGLQRVPSRAVTAGYRSQDTADRWLDHLAAQPFFASATLVLLARLGLPRDAPALRRAGPDLARFGGPHMEAVLDVIARATTTSPETLRAQCEVREAAYLASDLRAALKHPDARAPMAADRLRGLEELTDGRYWWRHSR